MLSQDARATVTRAAADPDREQDRRHQPARRLPQQPLGAGAERHGLTFTPLPEVEWQVYRFKSPLLKLNDIFPEGIQIPAMYPGRQILHLPTVKTHGHAVMTGR